MKIQLANLTIRLLVSLLFLTTSCGGSLVSTDSDSASETGTEESDAGDSEDTGSSAVPGFSSSVSYLYIPTVENHLENGHEEPPLSVIDLILYAGGRMIALEGSDTTYNSSDELPLVDDGDISSAKEENKVPDTFDCVMPQNPGTGTITTGGAGTNVLPTGMDASWAGYGQGGCSTWATAMCNRILGVTDADSQVDQGEWNGIAGAIGQDANGGSSASNQAKYYEDLGYCVEEKKFAGSAADYQEMEDKVNDNCDVKIFVWTRNSDGTYSNGHVETVTNADGESQSATTNSWGTDATVTGGNDGNFNHSQDGSTFQDGAGNPLWPANGTEVWVHYVCECSFWESLGKALGF